MKKISLIFLLLAVLVPALSAGVIKKTKSEITFQSFGKFSVWSEEKISVEKRFTNTKSDFKGQGLVGGLAGKTILRSGDFGEIVDLSARLFYQLDHKKKEYTIAPIEKIKEAEAGGKIEEEKAKESEIKITRSEFKVEPTDEEKIINQFPCRKYLITWLVGWQNAQTGSKGQELLSSEVWTTPFNGVLKDSEEEEIKFERNYMQALGIEIRGREKEILGESWINLLAQLKPGEEKPRLEAKNIEAQIEKIQGYPVLVSGKYYSSGEGGEAEEEKSSGVGGGLVGGLAKKVLKKKPKETEAQQPILTYYVELVEVNLAPLSESDFQVPAGYKKK